MPHAHTAHLFDEWRRQRSASRLPARPRMSAAAFGARLPQVFILGLEREAWRFRLAGGLLVDLHGRELRGESFTDLWARADRAAVLRAMEHALRAAAPALLHVRAEDVEGRWAALEVGLAPLTGPTGAADRMIGLYQPVSMMARLEGATVARLRLTGATAIPRAEERAPLRLVVDNVRPTPDR